MRPAAIYARVSSDRQKEEHTIASQTEALRAFALQQGFSVPDEWVFEDEGYSGATLIRPGLEKVRDLAAEGQIDAVLVHSPDRLSPKYAYQVLLIEEFTRNNVGTRLHSICRLADYAEWFQDDTVFSWICRWSNDRRPACIRHSLPSYSASRNTPRARASELVLDKTRCVKLDDLSVWSIL